MELDGAIANAKPIGDLFVGQSLRSECQHLLFAGGEGMVLSLARCGVGSLGEFLLMKDSLLSFTIIT